MSAAIIIILTIINAMLVWALLSQARQYRKIIDAYKEQADEWHAIAVDAISKNLEPRLYHVSEGGHIECEGTILEYQGKRNGD